MASPPREPPPIIEPTLAAASPTGWRRWTSELGQYGQGRIAEFSGILIAGFVGAIALLGGFAWLADQVLTEQTQAMDLATLTFLERFASPPATLAARALSLMGSEAVIVLSVLLLIFFAWQRRWGAAAVLVVVAGGVQVLNDVLKTLFHRTRPEPVLGLITAQQYSFPSGHAMVSAAFYFYLVYLVWRLMRGRWRGLLVVCLVVLVLLIGLARLYLEAHYLTDVIAGYIGGFLWTDAVILGSRTLRVRARRRATPQSATPAPDAHLGHRT
jgi:undecaprenyl-diphosphatase